ncbi:hypothetical protein GCM10007989_37570 [Devosia pacifica]|uniref:DUF465 domain-containing protein n=1 Tax=Devosia pacifica TaxID=1335967 RepID=A0A918SGV4_9HYPH|nr:DUF465 domain-containing protein [Devosia pacifica]GHA38125.1 hypothetical protein GCM10007989_37570 [Devosia pacifica]
MTTEGHISALERRHRELDEKIQAESGRRMQDPMLISTLKRKKLVVKDELTRARSGAA